MTTYTNPEVNRLAYNIFKAIKTANQSKFAEQIGERLSGVGLDMCEEEATSETPNKKTAAIATVLVTLGSILKDQ